MPTYEYVCTECGTPLEIVQSIHEPSLTECPSCRGGRLRKVFGNVGVVFKGSGFYRTDSRRRSAASVPAKSEPASKPAATGGADAPSPAPASGSSSKATSAASAAAS